MRLRRQHPPKLGDADPYDGMTDIVFDHIHGLVG